MIHHVPQRSTPRRGRFALALAACVAVAGGCSEVKRQNITGTVTLNGKPLPGGVVQLHGPGDRLSTANLQPDGTFIATDLLPGEVRVAVVDNPTSKMWRGQGQPSLGKAETPHPKPVAIPAKYKDVKTSGLSYSVLPETTHIDVQLR